MTASRMRSHDRMGTVRRQPRLPCVYLHCSRPGPAVAGVNNLRNGPPS